MAPDIVTRRHDGYIHIVAETAFIDRRFLDDFIDEIDRALPDIPYGSYRLLLEVGAAEIKIDLITAFEAWRRAAAKGLRHTQIAYVVRGRPIHPIARLIETLSKTRHVQMRFFEDNMSALEWLFPDSPAR